MRDPKTHAKVLGLRIAAVDEARVGDQDLHRRRRLTRLVWHLYGVQEDHEENAGWVYFTRPAGEYGPRWIRTEVIPDTEEEA